MRKCLNCGGLLHHYEYETEHFCGSLCIENYLHRETENVAQALAELRALYEKYKKQERDCE